MWSVEVRVLAREAAIVSHPNAPLTVEGRGRVVVRIASGVPIAHVAAQMGVSRVTASKWWHRYKDEGGAGLGNRSSRPHHCPGVLEARWVEEIEGMRRTHKWSAARISSRTRAAPWGAPPVRALWAGGSSAWGSVAEGTWTPRAGLSVEPVSFSVCAG